LAEDRGRVNAWPQFVTRIDGIDVHFVKVEGRGPPEAVALSWLAGIGARFIN
jgi:hypothetical protein